MRTKKTPEELRLHNNAVQRERRRLNGNGVTKKYEKTQSGFLMRAHRNMRSRALGIQKKKAHLYDHITTVVTRQDFYAWSVGNPDLFRLWNEWLASGYDRKLTPSVDRIDSSGDYVLTNMRWITHSENSRLGSVSGRRKKAVTT
jgi:hypothetical protein